MTDEHAPLQQLPVTGAHNCTGSAPSDCASSPGADCDKAPEAAPPSTGVADEGQMLDALRGVFDPELMVNVVDLGLIYAINQDGEKVEVEMTLTSPACPAGPQIMQQSKIALERLPGISEVKVKLTMTPPWTPDRMTDEARDQLGIF